MKKPERTRLYLTKLSCFARTRRCSQASGHWGRASSSSPSGLNLLKWMLKSASESALSSSPGPGAEAGCGGLASAGQTDGAGPGLPWLFTGLGFCLGGEGSRALGNPMLFRASKVPSGSIIELITAGKTERRKMTTVDVNAAYGFGQCFDHRCFYLMLNFGYSFLYCFENPTFHHSGADL